VAILYADFFNSPVAVLHADYQSPSKGQKYNGFFRRGASRRVVTQNTSCFKRQKTSFSSDCVCFTEYTIILRSTASAM